MRLKEIAILTPYSAQKETIKQLAVKAKLLSEKGGEEGTEIKVATITESQGMKQKSFMSILLQLHQLVEVPEEHLCILCIGVIVHCYIFSKKYHTVL